MSNLSLYLEDEHVHHKNFILMVCRYSTDEQLVAVKCPQNKAKRQLVYTYTHVNNPDLEILKNLVLFVCLMGKDSTRLSGLQDTHNDFGKRFRSSTDVLCVSIQWKQKKLKKKKIQILQKSTLG